MQAGRRNAGVLGPTMVKQGKSPWQELKPSGDIIGGSGWVWSLFCLGLTTAQTFGCLNLLLKSREHKSHVSPWKKLHVRSWPRSTSDAIPIHTREVS